MIASPVATVDSDVAGVYAFPPRLENSYFYGSLFLSNVIFC